MRAERWPVSPAPRLAGARALQELAPLGPGAELTLHQLHVDYFDFTWSSLRHLGVPLESMEDVAQDVWLTVHRQLARFEGRSTARTWLFGIVLNTVRNLRRSLRRHPPPAPLSEDLLQMGVCPDSAHESNEALALVQRFLEGLDDPSRRLFTLYFLEGVPAAEAAEVLSLEVGFLYERARRMRRAFKRWFAAQHAELPDAEASPAPQPLTAQRSSTPGPLRGAAACRARRSFPSSARAEARATAPSRG